MSCNDWQGECEWFFDSFITTLCGAGAQTFLSWRSGESFAVEQKQRNDRAKNRLSTKFHCVWEREKEKSNEKGQRTCTMNIWVSVIAPIPLHPLSFWTLVWASHVRRWNTGWSIWGSCICSLVAGACDSKQGQRKKDCVELMVRISVSILTSSSWGLEQPDTTSRFLYRHEGLTTRQFFSKRWEVWEWEATAQISSEKPLKKTRKMKLLWIVNNGCC